MSEVKVLRNTTGVAQSVVHSGVQFVLKGYAEEAFELEVADKFLTQRAPMVTESVSTTYEPEVEGEFIWVANNTGNPDNPKKTITKKVRDKYGETSEIYEPNPTLQPLMLRRMYSPGETSFTTNKGSYAVKYAPAVPIELPPWKRRKLKKDVANWFLSRQRNSPMPDGAIASRPPSDFEPGKDWSLDDMTVYLRLQDPDAAVCQSESEITAKAGKGKDAEAKVTKAIAEAKDTTWKRIYFRLINPAYPVITRSEFHEIKTGRAEGQLSEAEALALVNQAGA